MDFQLYFNPIDKESLCFFYPENENRIGNKIAVHTQDAFPDLENVKIALIGIKEDRNAFNNSGCAQAPDAIRKQFYRLFYSEQMPAIADLGNIKTGHSVNDTYIVASEIIASLIESEILVIILGGSQDITFANYLAYQNLNQVINITSIDPRFDIGNENTPIKSDAYVNKIILSQPNCLFNYSNLGYQSYLVDNKEVELMDNLLFDMHRLGLAQQDMIDSEPIIRNADMVSIDMSAVRFSDAPGNKNVGPNGFSGVEICTLCHYAGANDKLSSFGIYEYNPQEDIKEQTAMLIAQMLWYFIQGYMQRSNDLPDIAKSNFYKYYVSLFDDAYQIIFYQSKTSHLWWMEIPMEEGNNVKYNRNYIIPCSMKDYQTACNNEVPERWLLTYKKLK